MQKRMKVQCSLLPIVGVFFFCVCVRWQAQVCQSVLTRNQVNIMNIYSISLLTSVGKPGSAKAALFVLKAVVLADTLTKDKRKVNKNVREFWSLSSTNVDDTRSTVAKDLTWALVIIPAFALAYLCNLGLNKALWNTICTNRHLKKLFSSIWVTFSHCKQ